MRAADIMVTDIVSIEADVSVPKIARELLKHGICTVPVVDDARHVIGVVSESDLIRRAEISTRKRKSSWITRLFSRRSKAADYTNLHGTKASDVMTRNVMTVTEDAPLDEIAQLIEEHNLRRVPVVCNDRLVGVISRANLLYGLVAQDGKSTALISIDDQTIRQNLLNKLEKEVGLFGDRIDVIVIDGIVQLWGTVELINEKKLAQLAAENTAGVKDVENYLGQVPAWIWAD